MRLILLEKKQSDSTDANSKSAKKVVTSKSSISGNISIKKDELTVG